MCVCVCACVNQNVLNFLIGKVYTLTHTLYIYTPTYIYIYSKLVTSLTIRDHLTSNLITNLQIYSFTYIYLLTFLIQISFYRQFSNSYGIYINHRTIRGIIQIQTKIHIYIYIYISRYMK